MLRKVSDVTSLQHTKPQGHIVTTSICIANTFLLLAVLAAIFLSPVLIFSLVMAVFFIITLVWAVVFWLALVVFIFAPVTAVVCKVFLEVVEVQGAVWWSQPKRKSGDKLDNFATKKTSQINHTYELEKNLDFCWLEKYALLLIWNRLFTHHFN